MNPPSRPRKVATVLLAAGLMYWAATKVLLVNGTKASFTFIDTQAPPGGGPVTAKTTTATTATPAKTTPAAAAPAGTGGR